MIRFGWGFTMYRHSGLQNDSKNTLKRGYGAATNGIIRLLEDRWASNPFRPWNLRAAGALSGRETWPVELKQVPLSPWIKEACITFSSDGEPATFHTGHIILDLACQGFQCCCCAGDDFKMGADNQSQRWWTRMLYALLKLPLKQEFSHWSSCQRRTG